MSRRTGEEVLDGLVVVDKPPGITSHDVVSACRRIFDQRRVGHAGTLDPPATGVLCVGLGRVTRLLRFVGSTTKAYVGELVLGTSTTTMDDQGEVVGRWDMSAVGAGELESAAEGLRGEIWQVPPMVSAVKVGGRRLHELARQGVEVPRQARRVQVEELTVAPGSEQGVWRLEVRCSAGTYVRVIADEMGRLLGGGAHLRRLRRVAVGSFRLEDACELDELARLGPGAVLSPVEAVRDLASVELDGELAAAVRHGRPLDAGLLAASGPAPWALTEAGGRLLAVYEEGGPLARPAVVMAPA
ncbi:MAG: tRNA pseudouridine(55) synthase TruB [Acidimicrobiales bacterium]